MKRAALALVFALAATASASARADGGPDANEADFAAARAALESGSPAEAIARLEALADRGVTDAALSFDRGLAYALRVRVGAEVPGDLGRAAQGFEEARELTDDETIDNAAAGAVTVIRAEVARRRARTGEQAVLEQHDPLLRTLSRLLPEDVWSILALLASVLLGAGLFVRLLSEARRVRVGAAVVSGISAPLLLIAALLAARAKSDRLSLREAVVIAEGARPADEQGLVIRDVAGLPEAARVELLTTKPGWAKVRWGSVEGWVPQSAVRIIARR